MSISLRIRILLIFGPSNPNTLKKLESEYIFFNIEGIRESNYFQTPIHLFGQNPNESIYGLESEYISFFAIEYEYNYPCRDMDLSPKAVRVKIDKGGQLVF